MDIDGTLYQPLDLDDIAFHASQSNDRSIGIEIVNPADPLVDPNSDRSLLPLGVRGSRQLFYGFYPEQVRAVIKLVGLLCTQFQIPKRLPGANGSVSNDEVPEVINGSWAGVVGHYHCAQNKGKIDPGVSLWEPLVAAGFVVE